MITLIQYGKVYWLGRSQRACDSGVYLEWARSVNNTDRANMGENAV